MARGPGVGKPDGLGSVPGTALVIDFGRSPIYLRVPLSAKDVPRGHRRARESTGVAMTRKQSVPFRGRAVPPTAFCIALGLLTTGGGACRAPSHHPKSAAEPDPAGHDSAPAAAANSAPAAAVGVAQVELSNPSKFARADEPVWLSYHELGLKPDDPRVHNLGARVGDVWLPTQGVDRDADGTAESLLLLPSFEAGQTLRVEVVARPGPRPDLAPRAHAEISYKAGGRWRPRKKKQELLEYVGGSWKSATRFSPPAQHTDHSLLIRYEGPGIESDRVGYRFYLDERNGFDVFGKKTREPVLAKVGLDGYESYHHMADWGMDLLKVGSSLGAGGFGFYDGSTVDRVSKLKGWTVDVTEDGPLYASFSTRYHKWAVAGQEVDLRATFSMLAGSRLVHVRLELSEDIPNLAIGTVLVPGTQAVVGPTDVPGLSHTYVGSWGKQSLSGDDLGLAVLFERGRRQDQVEDKASRISVMQPRGGELSYRLVAAWQGEPGGVQTQEEFARYLEQEAERLTMPIRQRLSTALSSADKKPLTAATALSWAQRLADSELSRKTLRYHYDGWDENRRRKPKFEYDIVGMQPLAYYVLNGVKPDPRYASVITEVTSSFVTEEGEILAYDESNYNMDSVAPGRNLLLLHQTTGADKYKKAAAVLRRQLKNQPRVSEGAFWHKKRYPHQVWLDGVYMGMPFLAHYSNLYENGESLEEVVNEFVVTRRRLRDEATGLYFHAWDEAKKQRWADPKTGRSRILWGRGLGWFSMALVDVLDFLPESRPELRKPLLEMVSELAPALLKARDAPTNTWWQVLDRPQALGNYRESSASAMFSYFLAKAVRKGYLPADPYKQAAVESFQGLVEEFVLVHPDGTISMTNQCLVAGLGQGRDGSYRYYMSEPVWQNDPKGNVPFILAGVEVSLLLSG